MDIISSTISSSIPSLEPYSSTVLWIVILAFFISFALSFGVGANDVANSFGTSVGSKVLTLRQACICATFMEIAGSMTLGYKVSHTIRTKMFDISMFDGQEKHLMLGYLSSLIGAALWNLFATFFGLPISGTHSIVGAIVGFAVVAKGFGIIHWMEIVKIVISWFVSPILSGIVSVILFLIIRYLIIDKENPLKPGLISLPIFYSLVVFVNLFSIIYEGPGPLADLTWWMVLCIALAVGIVIALVVWFIVVPRVKKIILAKLAKTSPDIIKQDTKIGQDNITFKHDNDTINHDNNESNQNNITESNNKLNNIQTDELVPTYNSLNGDLKINGVVVSKDVENGEKVTESNGKPEDRSSDDDIPVVAFFFRFLQIMTACFGSFVHGGNDVSNAIGPLAAILIIYFEGDFGQSTETPWYILFYGGVGISVGLWVWGRRVIKTMGNDLTKITPSTGFTMELGAAMTVLLASKLGLPVSTTHCQVGSVVLVGLVRYRKGVNWKLFRNIAIAWILTVPATALCSAASMALLQYAL